MVCEKGKLKIEKSAEKNRKIAIRKMKNENEKRKKKKKPKNNKEIKE